MASFLGELHIGVEQPISAEIFLEPRGLRAVALSGAVHRFRYPQLIVDVEEDGTVIGRSATDGMAVASRQSGFIEALRRAGVRIDDHVLASLAEGKNRRRGLVWFTAFMGASLSLILLVLSLPYLAVVLVDYLPRTLDQRLGEATGREVDLGNEVIDPRVTGAMTRMLERLSPHVDGADFDLHVRVVDTPLLNAFALPGGTMLVTTALLECADGPEQVAGVLAHEIAHVTLRHGLRSFMRGAGLMVMIRLFFGDQDSVASAVAQGAAITVILGHSREHESAADMEALRTMHAAGLDGSALRTMLLAMEMKSGVPDHGAPEWASTHPNVQARAEAIDLALATMEPMDPDRAKRLDVDWQALLDALRQKRQ